VSAPNGRYFSLTDDGNAKLFAQLFRGRVLYDASSGKWHYWNNQRWVPDSSKAMWRMARMVARQRLQTARKIKPRHDLQGRILNTDELEARKRVIGWASQSLSVQRVKLTLESAQSERGLSIAGTEWDKQPLLLGCRNGVLDLSSGKLLKPDPRMRITKQANAVFDSKAKCPLWEKTLAAYWPDDPEMIDFIQRAVGYSLTGSISEQVFFCLFGEGANGKSTFLGTVQKLLGDYAYTMPFSTVEFDNRSAISNDVAKLQGMRFVLSSETQEDIRLNEGRIKSLTGDSTITARFLHQEYFTFQPVGKFWLAFNHKPRIIDQSYGLWRRLRLILFDQTFNKESRIKGLEQKLLEEMPGILAWAMRGCLEWQARGLEATAAIERETEQYRQESNILGEFMEEFCIRREGLITPKADLYIAYLEWCENNKERYPLGKKTFAQRVLGMGIRDGFKKQGHSNVRIWYGLGLQSVTHQNLLQNAEPIVIN